MPKVTIYTSTTCVFCRAEKEFFKQRDVDYDEQVIDRMPGAREALFRDSTDLLGAPAMGVPFTVVARDDGTRVGVLGFDQPKLASSLSMA